jgi:hypothetical protein
MNRVPQEILAQIIEDSLFKGTFAQYSSVSQAWKGCVERLTFRSVKVRTDRLDEFVALVDGKNASRWAIIQRIRIVFVLPSLPNTDGCCIVERRPDRQVDSASFSAAVVSLFKVLADLNDRLPRDRSLSLRFEQFRRRNDDQELGYVTNAGCKGIPKISRGKHSRRETREAYARSGQFELLHEREVPTVRCITSFEYLPMYDDKDLKDTWLPCIISRLPNVTTLSLSTSNAYENGRLRRIDRTESM